MSCECCNCNNSTDTDVKEREARITSLENEVAEVKMILEEIQAQANDNEERIDAGENRMDALSLRIDTVQDEIGELAENEFDDQTKTAETETESENSTPLETVVKLPEHVVDENLTANQKRARFVASDIQSFGESVPAGVMIRWSSVRRVLRASDLGKGHGETVRRVLDILDDLGNDTTKIVSPEDRETRVVFNSELVRRLHSHRCETTTEVGV